nr:hypothetical protein CIT39_05075 [Bradyrhizobium symbiodeficiens]
MVNAQLANIASSAKLAEAAIAGLNGVVGLIQEAARSSMSPAAGSRTQSAMQARLSVPSIG